MHTEYIIDGTRYAAISIRRRPRLLGVGGVLRHQRLPLFDVAFHYLPVLEGPLWMFSDFIVYSMVAIMGLMLISNVFIKVRSRIPTIVIVPRCHCYVLVPLLSVC